MAQARLLTFRDSIDYVRDYLGSTVTAGERNVRDAIHDALEALVHGHNWTWLLKHGRIQLKAADSDGTVTYDHTGNASGYERYVTLAGTTFPTDAYDYYIRIDDVVCAIEQYIDTTHCTLDVNLNPGADVAAGTDCTIYPGYYLLPADFVSFSGPWGEEDWNIGQYIRPQEWLAWDRYRTDTGSIRRYTIKAVDDLYGQLGLFIHPASDAAETLDFMYKRIPRELRYSGYATADTAGTITVTAASATVTGSGTSFESGMVDSVLRIGTDATNVPTRRHTTTPFAEEHTIKSVASATSLTLYSNVTTARSGVKYVVSDPLDIDRGAYQAFLALSLAHLGMSRNAENKAELWALAEQQLGTARSADGRITQRRVCGLPRQNVYRLKDSGVGSDVE